MTLTLIVLVTLALGTLLGVTTMVLAMRRYVRQLYEAVEAYHQTLEMFCKLLRLGLTPTDALSMLETSDEARARSERRH